MLHASITQKRIGSLTRAENIGFLLVQHQCDESLLSVIEFSGFVQKKKHKRQFTTMWNINTVCILEITESINFCYIFFLISVLDLLFLFLLLLIMEHSSCLILEIWIPQSLSWKRSLCEAEFSCNTSMYSSLSQYFSVPLMLKRRNAIMFIHLCIHRYNIEYKTFLFHACLYAFSLYKFIVELHVPLYTCNSIITGEITFQWNVANYLDTCFK